MAGSPQEDPSLLLRLEHAVDDLLTSHREPDSALPGILEAIGTTLGWPLASVWMWQGEGLHQVASWSVEHTAGSDSFHEFLQHSREFRFAPGEGLPGKVW